MFPLLKFWGPGTDISSTRWIVDAALEVQREHAPTLSLVYLPHLDYNFQRFGPDDPRCRQDLREVDAEAGRLIDAVARARRRGRRALGVRDHAGRSAGASQSRAARARLPHACAASRSAGRRSIAARAGRSPSPIIKWRTSTCRGPEDVRPRRRAAAQDAGRRAWCSIARRSASSASITSEPASWSSSPTRGRWFTYYFWLDDALAPDYARTVDIHRKPGYDPVELFVDPKLRFPKLRVARRLARKLLGFRYYMDVIGLDASIVRGSHGRLPDAGRETSDGPVFICSNRAIERDAIAMTDVKGMLLDLQFGK